MKSLAIAATHPIQYYVPIYRELSKNVNLHVFYNRIPTSQEQGSGYGVAFQWDVDLLSGYTQSAHQKGRDELLQGIRDRRWSAVLIHGWHDSLSANVITEASRYKVPLFIRGDSHLHTPRPFWKRWLNEIIQPSYLRKFAACLNVGTWNEEYYRHFGVPSERIISSPHCVDNAWFHERSTQVKPMRAQLRKTWEIPDSAFVFLFVGRFISVKQLHLFLHALQDCQKSGAHFHGLLVGSGPFRKELENQARHLNVPTTFTGFLNQTEVLRAYAAADALVLPSHSETWGLVVNEALACGLPCIVSDKVGSHPDLIIPNVTGQVFQSENLEALSAALKQMAAKRSELQFSHPEWQKILSHHSSSNAAMGIQRALDLYGL
jgi:glycosyltransferase involved in cell wall biosynthesis